MLYRVMHDPPSLGIGASKQYQQGRAKTCLWQAVLITSINLPCMCLGKSLVSLPAQNFIRIAQIYNPLISRVVLEMRHCFPLKKFAVPRCSAVFFLKNHLKNHHVTGFRWWIKLHLSCTWVTGLQGYILHIGNGWVTPKNPVTHVQLRHFYEGRCFGPPIRPLFL